MHTELGPKTPLEKWTEHFFGPKGAKRPLPPVYQDCLELRRDWYPRTTATLQRYGLRVEYLDYVNETLMDLIPERKSFDPVEIRRDPFEIRIIHARHPKTGEWMEVPTRHLRLPDASLFELRTARREALARKCEPKPDVLIDIMEEQRAHREQAIRLTKRARRDAAKRDHHKRIAAQAAAADRKSKGRDALSVPEPAPEDASGKRKTKRDNAPPPAPARLKPDASGRSLGEVLHDISEADVWADLDG